MSSQMKRYKRRLKEPRTYIMMLLGIVSIWFLIQFLIFGMFSWQTQAFAAGIVVFIDLVSYDLMFMRKRQNKKAYRRAGKILGSLAAFVICFCAFAMNRIDAVIASMYCGTETGTEVSLIVMEDSPLKEVDDLSGSDVTGIQETLFSQSTAAMLAEMETRLGTAPETKDCGRLGDMIDELYDGTVSAIILDEKYRAAAYDQKEDFGSRTRVIARVDHSEKRKNISKKVEVEARPYLVLISGIEAYGTIDTISRPDVFVLAAVDPRTEQILFVHIPADSYVPIRAENSALEQFADHQDLLMNSGLLGAESAVWTLEELFGVPVNYYVQSDFSVLDEMADAVGGIAVQSEDSFDKFCAIVSRLSVPSLFYKPVKVASILKKSVRTDLSVQEIKQMIRFEIKEAPEWEIRSVTLQGTLRQESSWLYGDQIEAFCPDKDSVEEIADQIRSVLRISKSAEEEEGVGAEDEIW